MINRLACSAAKSIAYCDKNLAGCCSDHSEVWPANEVACPLQGHDRSATEDHTVALDLDSEYHWQTPDERTSIPFTRDRRQALELASQWDLCITGDSLLHLQFRRCEADFIPLAQVLHGQLAVSPTKLSIAIWGCTML